MIAFVFATFYRHMWVSRGHGVERSIDRVIDRGDRFDELTAGIVSAACNSLAGSARRCVPMRVTRSLAEGSGIPQKRHVDSVDEVLEE